MAILEGSSTRRGLGGYNVRSKSLPADLFRLHQGKKDFERDDPSRMLARVQDCANNLLNKGEAKGGFVGNKVEEREQKATGKERSHWKGPWVMANWQADRDEGVNSELTASGARKESRGTDSSKKKKTAKNHCIP